MCWLKYGSVGAIRVAYFNWRDDFRLGGSSLCWTEPWSLADKAIGF